MPSETSDATASVEATINYLSDGSFINRRFVAPGIEANTGSYEPHIVSIHDARAAREPANLNSHGFELASRPSAVRDFFDKPQVDALYPGEVIETVKALSGADVVIPMGWMVRTSGDLSAQRRQKVVGYQHQGGLQPPAGEAHVDMMPERAEALATALYDKAHPDGRPFRRFIASSLWRTFSPPPQDYPLALCDGRSVRADEGVPNTMIVVDELPDLQAQLAPIADEANMPAAAIFRYDPAHRWWYYPNMTRDEVLMFKFHDSDNSKAWRTPHTAFHDASRPEAHIRESIEFRTVAYFLD